MRRVKLAVVVVAALLLSDRSQANLAVGRQDYMVMGRESQVRDLIDEYYSWTGSGNALDGMASVVSLTASANDQIVAYDHWEDGFELDALAPAQPSTMLFRLRRGQTVSLVSDRSLDQVGGTAVQCLPGTVAVSSITQQPPPADPRCAFSGQVAEPAPETIVCTYTCSVVGARVAPPDPNLRFDGGDRVSSIGGPLPLVHQLYPKSTTTGTSQQEFMGGAVEHFSRQSMRGFLSFRIPVGQGLGDRPGRACAANDYRAFCFARVFITAFDDDTIVTLSRPDGTGAVSLTLDAGESYASSNSDGTGATVGEAPGPDFELVKGTRIDASKEVAVAMGNAGAGDFHTDLEAVLPVRAYGRDFVVPFGARSAGGDADRLFLFNPNAAPVDVDIFEHDFAAGGYATTRVTLPPNDGDTYDLARGPNSNPRPPVAARIRATLPIWGVGVHDADGGGRDFSFSLIPTRFLQTEYYIPYTPGSGGSNTSTNPDTNQGNALFIAPIEDNTRVYVTYPGKSAPSIVDITGNALVEDTADTAADDCPSRYGCTALDPGYTLRIYETDATNNAYEQKNSALKVFGGVIDADPGEGGFSNLAGARIVASAPVVVVYGQDADTADTGNGNLDMGFAIVPPSPLLIEELFSADLAALPSSIPGAGNVTLTMSASANSQGPVSGLALALTVSSTLFATPPTATITNPDSSTYLVLATVIGSAGGRTTYGFVLDGSSNLDAFETVGAAVTFDATAAGATEALALTVTGTLGGQALSPSAALTLTKSPLEVTKSGPAQVPVGATIPYTFTVRNNGGSTLTQLRLSDALAEGLTFSSGTAGCAPDPINPATIACALADLPVGQSASVSITVATAALPGGSTVTNRARATANAQPAAWSNEVTTIILVPTWTLGAFVSPTTVVDEGGQFTFTGTASNTSLVTADNVVLQVPFASVFDYVAGSFELDPGTGIFDSAPEPDATALLAREIAYSVAAVPGASTVRVRFKLTVSGVASGTYGLRLLASSTQTPMPQGSAITNVTITADDSIGPAITLTSPGATATASLVAAQGVIADATGVSSATIALCDASCTICGSTQSLTLDPTWGTFSHPITPLQPGASYCLKLTAVDTSGAANTSVLTHVFAYQPADTTPPAAPSVTSPAPGAAAQGAPLVVTGTAEPGSTVTVTVGGTTVTTTANPDGTYTITVPGPIPEGPAAISVTATDPAGNTSVPTIIDVIIDNTPPAPPVVTSPASGTVVDPSGVVVTGTGEPGTTVTITIGDTTVTASVNPDGTFTVTVPGPFDAADTLLVVTLTDAAGNVSAPATFSVGIGSAVGDQDGEGARDGFFVSGGVRRGCACDGRDAAEPSLFLALFVLSAFLVRRRVSRCIS